MSGGRKKRIERTRAMRALRERMWKADPHCHWCGELTVMTTGNPRPWNAATLDHILTRQQSQARRSVPLVLACLKCNDGRNRIETRMHRKAVAPKPSEDINVVAFRTMLQATSPKEARTNA